MPPVPQAIKRHGGKAYLAKWIVSNMPLRAKNPNDPAADDQGWIHYVEPYFGGGSVLFANDPEGISEVVNDLDKELTCFWKVLQTDRGIAVMKRILEAVPCSEYEFNRNLAFSDIDRAVAFFVRNRQSRQGLGKEFATLAKTRTRRGMNELPSAWLTAIEGLPEVHARMKRVVVLDSEDGLKVIDQQDGPRTLFYLDPPYLHGTRADTDSYDKEMTEEQHIELLDTLVNVEGRFVLSGYPSALYDSYAEGNGWRRVEKKIDNKAGSGPKKREMTECLWMNY